MEYGKALIDKARNMCGGLSPLAEELDVALPNLSAVAAGKRPIPEEWVPGLAVIAGVDVTEALHETRAEKFGYNHPKVKVLEKKALHGVVAMLLFFVTLGHWQPSEAYENHQAKFTSLYIVERVRAWFRRQGLPFGTWPSAIRTDLDGTSAGVYQ